MKYKYVPVFISYDKVADKMNHLAAQGYEYDKEAIVAIRMKKVSETSDKQYKFIFDKNFTPEIEEYYKVSGWKLYKFQVYNLFRLAEGTSSSYPIYTDTETELEIVKYRLLRFIVLFILGAIVTVPTNASLAFSGGTPQDYVVAAAAMTVTAANDPFIGLLVALVVKYIFVFIG